MSAGVWRWSHRTIGVMQEARRLGSAVDVGLRAVLSSRNKEVLKVLTIREDGLGLQESPENWALRRNADVPDYFATGWETR